MIRTEIPIRHGAARRARRRGAVIVYVASSVFVVMGFAALAIDIGRLYVSRTELQATADAAALAAAERMLDQNRLRGVLELNAILSAARSEAVAVAARHRVLNVTPVLDPTADVLLGHLTDPRNPAEQLDYTTPASYNSARVIARRNSIRNGPVEYLFATVFGHDQRNVGAEATATFRDHVVGYRVDDGTGNAELLPLALHLNAWLDLLSGSATTGDNWSYNPDTGEVTAGSDGILELNLYPGAGPTQLPPGNFGTVDIGSPNNSTADISRQIRYGVNAGDLAYFGGELRFGSDGTLTLNGDTGLSAAIKDDLLAIRGLPRSIPVFNAVSGPGNNANFTVVSFAGIRIMNVRLTGSMRTKEVIVQPAFVVDDAVITDASGSSYFVFDRVRLVR
ncbi:MAG: pilus assembly protein TadG-related protein [Phycisphaerae bacterium]